MSKKQKNILVLNGSPRKKGNTAFLVEMLENASQKHRIKHYDLYGMKIIGCTHCDACKKVAKRPGCILQDDFNGVLDEILSADVIVIASPVYCWSFSGCVSSALDRFYAYVKKDYRLILEGKKIVGVFTSGGDQFEGMELCVAGLKAISGFLNSTYIGSLVAANCSTPNELRQRKNLVVDAKALVAKF
jgi:multimeric flavodoxin WrbA